MIEITKEYATNAPLVHCIENEIQQVFLNILRNGAQAMADKEYKNEAPRFLLRTRIEDGYGVVEIEDNGPGIDAAVLKHIFEPFYTTKGPGRGTGLGLAVSYFIITDQHQGRMKVLSEPGKWTRFVIELPLADVKPPDTNENMHNTVDASSSPS